MSERAAMHGYGDQGGHKQREWVRTVNKELGKISRGMICGGDWRELRTDISNATCGLMGRRLTWRLMDDGDQTSLRASLLASG